MKGLKLLTIIVLLAALATAVTAYPRSGVPPIFSVPMLANNMTCSNTYLGYNISDLVQVSSVESGIGTSAFTFGITLPIQVATSVNMRTFVLPGTNLSSAFNTGIFFSNTTLYNVTTRVVNSSTCGLTTFNFTAIANASNNFEGWYALNFTTCNNTYINVTTQNNWTRWTTLPSSITYKADQTTWFKIVTNYKTRLGYTAYDTYVNISGFVPCLLWQNTSYTFAKNISASNQKGKNYGFPIFLNGSLLANATARMSNCSDVKIADGYNGEYPITWNNCNSTGSGFWVAPNISANSGWTGNASFYYNGTPASPAPLSVFKNFTMFWTGGDQNESGTSQVVWTLWGTPPIMAGDDGFMKFGRGFNFSRSGLSNSGNLTTPNLLINSTKWTFLARFETLSGAGIFFSSQNCYGNDATNAAGLLIFSTSGSNFLASINGGVTQTSCGTPADNVPIELALIYDGSLTCILDGVNTTYAASPQFTGIRGFQMNSINSTGPSPCASRCCWGGYSDALGRTDIVAFTNQTMGLEDVQNFFGNITSNLSVTNEEGQFGPNQQAAGAQVVNITLLLPINNDKVTTGVVNFTYNLTDGDNNTMEWCLLYRNTTLVSNATNVATNISGLSNNTRNFTIQSFPVGNWSWYVNCSDGITSNVSAVNFSLQVQPANTAPTVTLGFPAAGAIFNSTTVPINFSFTVTDVENATMAWCAVRLNTTEILGNVSNVAVGTNNVSIPSHAEGNYSWNAICSDGLEGSGSARTLEVRQLWWWNNPVVYVLESFNNQNTLNWTVNGSDHQVDRVNFNYMNASRVNASDFALHNFSAGQAGIGQGGQALKLANFTLSGKFNITLNTNSDSSLFAFTNLGPARIGNSVVPAVGNYLYVEIDNNRFRLRGVNDGVRTANSSSVTCGGPATADCTAFCTCGEYSYTLNRTMINSTYFNYSMKFTGPTGFVANLSVAENTTNINDGFQVLFFNGGTSTNEGYYSISAFNITTANFSSGATANAVPAVVNVTVRPANANTSISTLQCLVNVTDAESSTLTMQVDWFNNSVNITRYSNTSVISAGILEFASNITVTNQLSALDNYSCGIIAQDGSASFSTYTRSTNVTIILGNTAPTLNSISVSPSFITVNSTAGFGCKINASENDANNLSVTISWFNTTSAGVMANVSALASNYTLNTLVLNNTNVTLGNITPTLHKGEGWTCGAYVDDLLGGTAGPTNSSNISVTNLNPFLMGTPSIVPNPAAPGDRLNCTVQVGDLDNASIAVNFTWFRNGAYQSSFDSQTTCANSSTCYASALAFPVNKNQQWICGAVADDGVTGSGPVNSSSLTIGSSAPNTPFLRAPTNNTYVNFTFLMIANTTDPDGDNLSFVFLADSTSTPISIIANVTVLNGTMLTGNTTFSNFTEGLKVFWRVNVSDGTNSSNYSVIQEFTINSLGQYNAKNITPSPAFTNSTLNCSTNITDVNNATLLVNFTWYKNGVSINTTNATCTNNTLCFNPVTIPEINLTKADNWTCGIISDDAIMASNQTNVSLNVSDWVMLLANTVTVPATYANTTTVLNCTTSLLDLDAEVANVTFSWLKNYTLMDFNGTILNAANGTTVGTNYTIPAVNTSKYDNWTCQAQAVQGSTKTILYNSTVTIPNSKPVFNVNKTVPVALTNNSYFIVHINVTDFDNDAINTCLFNVTQPDGIRVVNTTTHHLNGSNGTNYATNLWNSTLAVNATLGGFYNFTVDCTDGDNSSVIFWRQQLVRDPISVSNYSFNSTYYYDTAYFTFNISTDDVVNVAYLNLTGPTKNVTLTMNRANTGFGYEVWNTSYDWNQSGNWYFNMFANNTLGNVTTRYDSFTVQDVVEYSPLNLTQTPDPRNATMLINISLWHDSNQRFSFNFTLQLENLSTNNYAQWNHSFESNNVTAPGNGNLTNPAGRTEFRLQANSTIADGIYTGNVSITRYLDNRTIKIPITLGINPPAGRIEATNSTGQLCDSGQTCKFTASITTSGAAQFDFHFNNTGNFTLTNCTPSFTNDFSGVSWIYFLNTTPWNLAINTSITKRVEASNPTSTGTFLGYIDVACLATSLGFTDRLNKNPANQPIINIVVPAASSTPGGGGGAPASTPTAVPAPANITKEELLEKLGPICGNGACDGSENPLGCPADCKVNLDTLVCISGEKCAWRQAYFGKAVFAGTLISILVLAFRPVLIGAG